MVAIAVLFMLLGAATLLLWTRFEMPKIVIVDDDPDFREMLELTLERLGHETRSVCSGLKLVGALKVWRPDVVLMDVRMAWVDGLTLTRSLKQSELFSSLPVIIMSASHDHLLVERALLAGAESFISKPFNPTVLSIRLGECLEARDEGRIKLRARTERRRAS